VKSPIGEGEKVDCRKLGGRKSEKGGEKDIVKGRDRVASRELRSKGLMGDPEKD